MTVAFVVNPASANGSTGKQWPAVSERLLAMGIELSSSLTGAPGDATRLAAEALRAGAESVVAVGGDGTLNEVANGFFSDGAPPAGRALGLLPFGTGGDFRRTLGIPVELEEAAQIIKARKLRPIDVGEIEMAGLDGKPYTRRFVNIADAGIGGVVVERVNRTSKALGGRASFQYAALMTLLTYKPQPVQVKTAEREWAGKAQNVVIANCQYFGGSMHVAPGAEPDDGMFDVIVFGDIARLQAIKSMNSIYKAQHVTNPKVQGWRSARVEVSSDERVLVDVDGEMCGTLPAIFSVLPKALPFIAP
jgi:YegS/Rv2252/BmrU family lipid kinase